MGLTPRELSKYQVLPESEVVWRTRARKLPCRREYATVRWCGGGGKGGGANGGGDGGGGDHKAFLREWCAYYGPLTAQIAMRLISLVAP